MKTVICKRFPPKGYIAMTLWPFLFVRKEHAPLRIRTINHENIHAVQQIETGIILFYIWYGVEYLIRRLLSRTHSDAYRNISFEAEAYANEWDDEYLSTRRFWEFLKYIKKHRR
jgi:hypothetical protein